MGWLGNVYLFSLGIGGLYILIAGALGAIGAAGHGATGGGEFAGGHGLDAGGHALDGGALHELPSADLPDADVAGSHAVAPALDGHGDSSVIAGHEPDAGHSAADISPLNLLNLMCLLASFGGTGIALLAAGVTAVLTFPLALAAGLLVTGLFHWLISLGLQRLQAPPVPTHYDMLGLDAEVLTPLEGEHFGEIAYVLDGQRYTSPARLAGGERAGRKDPVRIVRVEGSTVYVEPRRALLD
jgi:membrane protein implicated in regulation of membrane protease activity